MADDSLCAPLILTHCFKNIKNADNNVSADCKICSKTIKGKLNATTNFLKHLRRKGHDSILKEYEGLKLTNLKRKKSDGHDDETAKKLKQTTIDSNITKSVNFDSLLIDFIVDTMSPVSIVENNSFKKLLGCVQNLPSIPKIMCRRTCAKKINEKFTDYKENLKSCLKYVDFVCTTADIWSSSKRSYMGMTVHWIDSKTYQRNSYALACRRFKGSHTYEKITEIISEIHSEYDIAVSKILRTVTDNASNMVKAFNEFKPVENESGENENSDSDDDVTTIDFLELSGIVDDFYLPKHERCATHTLHLIASTDISKLKYSNNATTKLHESSIAKCQSLWNLCSRSPKACETFLEFSGKSPTFPCQTRWNSYFNCIQDLLNLQQNLKESFKILHLNPLKDNEITYLTEYNKCLKPIAEAITSLEGEKNIFYGHLLPELMRIRKIINFIKSDNLIYCGELVNLMEKALKNRFEKFLNFDTLQAKDAILASVSHPFFKLKWVSKEHKETVKNLFLSEVRKLKYAERREVQYSNISQERSAKQSDSYYMLSEDSDSSTNSSSTTFDLEALQYLKEQSADFSSLNNFPTIRTIFLKYNTCLPSSSPVERLFSFGGMIMRPHRRHMSDELFEKLVVMKSFSNK